jgi:hypothetical protein
MAQPCAGSSQEHNNFACPDRPGRRMQPTKTHLFSTLTAYRITGKLLHGPGQAVGRSQVPPVKLVGAKSEDAFVANREA